MPSPFDTWPALPNPASAGAPAREGSASPPADPATGEVTDADGFDTGAFLIWVKEQLGRTEAYSALAADRPAWCPTWWKHPEVLERLIVAYEGYTTSLARQNEGEGLALSSWWIQHWDRHAAIIFDKQRGPFRACDTSGHLTRGGRDTLTIRPEDPPQSWGP
ncbi:hypothetical protein AX769_22475 (plasmid) [Frondihabitans sp. PAMC 28766]|uniref:DUF4913 domain-containing protein n=1 Tax=Frondihabitans sp. PAMC 28766 TaxID=1795630 RepID=UPI00078E0703|nr:DUF4913 domain-containing protein [Frondihabitans sp. PAMC 28766]AMM22900.1 hypothetical protein AX769_22475 [Frondihabitans sp. PAMC 28766]